MRMAKKGTYFVETNRKQASRDTKHMGESITKQRNSTSENQTNDLGRAVTDHFHKDAIEVSHSPGRNDEISLPSDRKGKVTPRNIGHVVNLADGSGKMNTRYVWNFSRLKTFM